MRKKKKSRIGEKERMPREMEMLGETKNTKAMPNNKLSEQSDTNSSLVRLNRLIDEVGYYPVGMFRISIPITCKKTNEKIKNNKPTMAATNCSRPS